MDDTYDAYQVVITTLRPATDAQNFLMRVGTGAGPTYQSASYHWASQNISETATGSTEGSASDTSIFMGESLSNTAGENSHAIVDFGDPEVAQRMMVHFKIGFIDDASVLKGSNGCGFWASSTTITAIRFLFGSGNIATGRFSLYGKTKV
jgi:hypothetical protein